MTDWSVGVVIPAHDEAGRIGHCLAGVRVALEAVRPLVDHARAVVVADRCQDATVAVARSALGRQGWVIGCEAGSAGAARAIGVASLLDRHRGDPSRLWIANTDADTRVDPSWLLSQLAYARSGIAAVAGVVEVDTFAEHSSCVPDRFEALYRGPVDEPHPHVHGANLGVRGDAYLAVGGWKGVQVGEDQHLWAALHAAGYPCASPRSLVVATSGRARSRVAGGFATWLTGLAAS